MKRKVLITGASEGIGREFAHAFAKAGYQVYAVARNEARLRSLMAELGTASHSYVVADLSTDPGIEATAKILIENPIDVLVNNAGFGGISQFDQATKSSHLSMLNLNIESLVSLSHTFLQTAKRGAALVNVASVLAFIPSPYHSVYAATKAFVRSFSLSLWSEQKARGVYVMALCPGSTMTEFNTRAGGSDDRIPSLLQQTSAVVVTEAMRELERRVKPVVVTGFWNKLITFATRFTPTGLLVDSIGKQNARVGGVSL